VLVVEVQVELVKQSTVMLVEVEVVVAEVIGTGFLTLRNF
jgi:hypothetical protein